MKSRLIHIFHHLPNHSLLWWISLGCGILVGCLNTEYKLEGIGEPILEAYIEYPGPPSQWAGPKTHLLHIDASGTGQKDTAKGVWTHGHIQTEIGGTHHPRPGPLTEPHIDEVRDTLQDLAASLKNPMIPLYDCLSPIRVRLIDEHGNVIHGQACQGQKGWPQIAHELTARWIERAHFNSYPYDTQASSLSKN